MDAIATFMSRMPPVEITQHTTQQRIIGFDIARAYAIFGMFIVNFNFSFGAPMAPTDVVGNFLNIFTGNSTAQSA